MIEQRTRKQLEEMQAWDFNRKVAVAQTRIIEFYNRFEGKCFISFSGGKDSTVLLHIARQIFPDIEAVYVDTGLEYPEVRNFVKTFPNITWIKPEMNFRRVIAEYGYPMISKEQSKKIYYAKKGAEWCMPYVNRTALDSQGRISMHCIGERWKKLFIDQDAPFTISSRCCDIMKKKPLHNYETQSGKFSIVGTMAIESATRTQAWMSTGCNSFEKGKEISKPLSIWTEKDIYIYILRNHLQISSVYGEIIKDDNGNYKTTGVDRTGCMFCGFGCHIEKSPNRFQRMRVTHPKQWEYCMKPVEEGGLGMKAVLDYCGIPTGYEDSFQMTLWDEVINNDKV